MATHLPKLKQLVCMLFSELERMRRMDCTVQHDHVDLQRKCAIQLFTRCPMLEVASFNGVPPDWEHPCLAPGRVWVKQSTEDGAFDVRMAGRECLGWKLSESVARTV